MSITKKVFWLLLFCLCATITASSQTELSKADSLMEAELYHQAGLMYEYINWKEEDPSIRIKARLGRAQALKNLQQYEQAASVLGSINLLVIPSELRGPLVYEQVLIHYLNEDYHSAASRGEFGKSVFRNTTNDQIYENYLLLMSLTYYQLDHWDKGMDYASSFLRLKAAADADSLIANLQALNSQAADNNKNPQKAGWLSTFVPGLGQLYAGEPKDGFTSFLLTATGLGVATFAALNGYYVTAWLAASLVIQRIYLGGREQAVQLVEKKNRLKQQKRLQPVMDILFSVT